MIGIDAPESGFDENSLRRAQYQVKIWGFSTKEILVCGKAATLRAKELCPEGSDVEVIGNQPDKYKRRLAYVICNGINVNLRLVEEGLVGRYPYPGDPEKPTHCVPAPEEVK
jgi:endonuclease YncB( thermonuclease family)